MHEPSGNGIAIGGYEGKRSLIGWILRRRHERGLNTINENPQISPMTQIFLCTFAPLRVCVKLFSEETT